MADDSVSTNGAAHRQPFRRARVLIVEDRPEIARQYKGFLRTEPFEIMEAASVRAAYTALAADKVHAIVLDLGLPDGDGLDVLKRAVGLSPAPAVIVVTADASIARAVEATRLGAEDYLVKPVGGDRLRLTLNNALRRNALEREVAVYRDELARDRFEDFIGASLPMLSVYRAIESAAASKATVFVTGESGTGKELCAAAIHGLSPRGGRPFVPLNCATIPAELMESEVFGHVKGAFTGAIRDKDGAAALADGGTLFLDEICEMAPALQSKLLRFLQTGQFTPVGGSAPVQTDIRFVCATNRDPLAEVDAGRFREDLYYRLHVVPIHLPPLREREGDVVLIAAQFLADFAREEGKTFDRLSPDAENALRAYDWPGNVRQLQNIVRHAVVLHDGPALTARMLPAPVGTAPELAAGARPNAARKPAGEPDASTEPGLNVQRLAEMIEPLEVLEKRAIERALALTEGDVKTAATLLKVSAATIYRKKKAWGEDGGPG